jgi:hypothetical protein
MNCRGSVTNFAKLPSNDFNRLGEKCANRGYLLRRIKGFSTRDLKKQKGHGLGENRILFPRVHSSSPRLNPLKRKKVAGKLRQEMTLVIERQQIGHVRALAICRVADEMIKAAERA